MNNFRSLSLFRHWLLIFFGFSLFCFHANAQAPTPFFRLYGPSFYGGKHFYTANCAERANTMGGMGFQYENSAGFIFPVPVAGSVAFYRLFNSSSGDHFYTANVFERQSALASYQDEGIAGYISATQLPGTRPLFRLYMPGREHFYTVDPQEAASLQPQGWQIEGIAGYVWNSGVDACPLSPTVPVGAFIAGDNSAFAQTLPLLSSPTASQPNAAAANGSTPNARSNVQNAGQKQQLPAKPDHNAPAKPVPQTTPKAAPRPAGKPGGAPAKPKAPAAHPTSIPVPKKN
jgi:hypothetical protein